MRGRGRRVQGELEHTIPIIAIGGKSLGVELCAVEVSIARLDVKVFPIGYQPVAGRPDAAGTAIGRCVEDGDELERNEVEAEHPAVIGANIPMGGEPDIDRAAENRERRTVHGAWH